MHRKDAEGSLRTLGLWYCESYTLNKKVKADFTA